MYGTTFNPQDNNMSNAFVALFSGIPTYMAALIGESAMLIMLGAVVSFGFFLLGKIVDVAIRIYFDRWNEKRLNGTKVKDSSTNSNRN